MVIALAVLVIVAMTALCVIGTEALGTVPERADPRPGRLSLLIFAVVALCRAVAGDSPLDALTPSITWLNPFGEGGAALTAGLLLGVFAYWGWESAVNLTEETTDSASAPGQGGHRLRRSCCWSPTCRWPTPWWRSPAPSSWPRTRTRRS